MKHGRNHSSKNAVSAKHSRSGAELEQSVGEALRRLRDKGRLSVRALASKCGFSPSFISQVELNQASPSLSSLERIAAGLGVTVGEFFKSSEQEEPHLVRSAYRPVLQSGWSRSQIESLNPSGIGSRLEALLVTMRSLGTSGVRLHARDTEMFVMVLGGSAVLHLENGSHVLRSGDAVTIPAGMPHRWENRAIKAVRLLKVSSR